MKQYIYSALALTAVMGFTSCQNEEVMPSVDNATRQVTLTITADRGDLDTRTTMGVVNGDLVTYWENTDKLIVTNEVETGITAQNFGVLNFAGYVDEADHTKAKFSNTITLPASTKYVRLTYLGKKYTANLDSYTGDIEYSVANQTGTLADLTQNDVLYTYDPITIPTDKTNFVEEDVMLTRLLSYGYFELKDLPVDLVKGDVIKVTDPNGSLVVMKKISVNKTQDYSSVQPTNTITITKGETGNKFYLAMVPQTCSLQFEVTKNGIKYTATLGENEWKATEYYREDANNTPIAVSEWTEEVLPTDPGDMSNWGAPTGNVTYSDNGLRTPNADPYTHGWLYNLYMGFAQNCFFNPIEFTSNGVVDGYLYSTHYKEPSYFQWGRWLGFPLEVGIAPLLSYNGNLASNYSVNDNSYPACIPVGTTSSLFQYTNSNIPAYYSRINTTTWKDWDVEKSKDAAIVFGVDPTSMSANKAFDYIVGGYNKDAKWSDRGANPCPTGYRLPTTAELRMLIPSTTSFSSNVEKKTSSTGKTYAMRWTVGTKTVDSSRPTNVAAIAKQYSITNNVTSSNSIPTLTIASFEIDANDPVPSANDVRFNTASSITIAAYGSLSTNGCINFYGARARIWSSESLQYASSTGVSGYAGACLEVRFSNGKVTSIGINTCDRAYGANIIPIRDPKAVGGTLQPYFPFNMIGRE